MRDFIFLTQEGLTKTPNNNDIDNLQVLGTAKGDDETSAFNNFIQENSHLVDADYDEVSVFELLNEKQHFFSIKAKNI